EDDGAGIESGEAREELERGGLPGAVRSDEPDCLALVDVERYIVHRSDPAEVLREVHGPNQRMAPLPRSVRTGRQHDRSLANAGIGRRDNLFLMRDVDIDARSSADECSDPISERFHQAS